MSTMRNNRNRKSLSYLVTSLLLCCMLCLTGLAGTVWAADDEAGPDWDPAYLAKSWPASGLNVKTAHITSTISISRIMQSQKNTGSISSFSTEMSGALRSSRKTLHSIFQRTLHTRRAASLCPSEYIATITANI